MRWTTMGMKYNKYGNKKITIDNIVFDSKKEARRYQQLKSMEKAGLITNLALQHKFVLQDAFVYKNRTYRKIEYIADFSYIRVNDDMLVIEDVKGLKTDVFKIKQKIFIKMMIEKERSFEFNLI